MTSAAPSKGQTDTLTQLLQEKETASRPVPPPPPPPPAKSKRRRPTAPAEEPDEETTADADESDRDTLESKRPVTGGRKKASLTGATGAARAPRSSSLKWEMEVKLLQKEIEHRDKELARLQQTIEKLEKQLLDERQSSQRFQQQVDGQKTNMMADLTYHMAKAHHSAMHTLQTAQTTNAQVLVASAAALNQSIFRLKDKGNRLKELMPPLPDLKQPNARQVYHEQVAAYLNKNVTKIEDGEALLKKIDATIADAQQALDDERKRISPDLSSQELQDLTRTLEEEQTRIGALTYEREMLAAGLAKQYARHKVPVSAVAPAVGGGTTTSGPPAPGAGSAPTARNPAPTPGAPAVATTKPAAAVKTN